MSPCQLNTTVKCLNYQVIGPNRKDILLEFVFYVFFFVRREILYLYLIKYETLYTPENLKYLHHWVMYECDKKYETEFLKNNTEPTPGACYKFDSADPNYSSKWPEVRQFCQKISLVWAVVS